MPIEVKERKDIPEKYKWDLSKLFAGDDAWEEALAAVDSYIPEAEAFQGTLNTAENIRAWMDFETSVSRKQRILLCQPPYR